MIDLSQHATNLHRSPDGVWRAPTHSPISYQDDGNATCFEVEDGSFWFAHRNAAILETLRRFPPRGELFDIGGGNGFVAVALERAGFPTVLVEPGAAGIRHARGRGLRRLVESTLEDAGFRDESLPAAGLFDVVEHLPDDHEVLKTLHRLLRPGGRLYLTVPAYQWLWSTADDHSGHHRRYTVGLLRDRLARAGFLVEYTSYLFLPMPIAILLRRVVPNRLGFGRKMSTRNLASALQVSSGLGMQLTAAWSAVELSWLRGDRTLPFGSSCVAVARRQ